MAIDEALQQMQSKISAVNKETVMRLVKIFEQEARLPVCALAADLQVFVYDITTTASPG